MMTRQNDFAFQSAKLPGGLLWRAGRQDLETEKKEMLWLRRKRNQSIIVGDDQIEILVGKVDGDTVRIGIEAPKSVSIMRSECYLAREKGKGTIFTEKESGE